MNALRRRCMWALVAVGLAQWACTLAPGGAAGPTPTPSTASTAQSQATLAATSPAATATEEGLAAPTATELGQAATAEPPVSATTAPTGGDMSETEMLAILQASFAAYPHRLNQTVFARDENITTTEQIEATDMDHIHYSSGVGQPTGSVIVTESILIAPTLYVKPANEGWRLATPDENNSVIMMMMGVDPTAYLMALSFVAGRTSDAKIYAALGDEVLNGVAVTHYQQTAPGAAQEPGWVNDVWIGVADQHMYQIIADAPGSVDKITLDYAVSLNIVAPVP